LICSTPLRAQAPAQAASIAPSVAPSGSPSIGPAPNAVSFLPLFTIDWNLTANVVHYDARLSGDRLDPKEPVVAYWIMNQTDGHRENLTLIERLKGYGFTIKPGKDPDTYDMVIVSVKQKTLHLAPEGGKLRIRIDIASCQPAYLAHVRVQAHKWHMLNIPEYAELIGNDVNTGAECREKVGQSN
jgi:hypothetical protein